MKKSLASTATAAVLGLGLALGAAAPAEAGVPREHRNALKSAQSYVRFLDISKQGLFDQLTSEYGGKFPKAAANYALRHVKVNYKKEALGAARSYDELLHLSDEALFDQLTSEYGGKFTTAQADWALARL